MKPAENPVKVFFLTKIHGGQKHSRPCGMRIQAAPSTCRHGSPRRGPTGQGRQWGHQERTTPGWALESRSSRRTQPAGGDPRPLQPRERVGAMLSALVPFPPPSALLKLSPPEGTGRGGCTAVPRVPRPQRRGSGWGAARLERQTEELRECLRFCHYWFRVETT